MSVPRRTITARPACAHRPLGRCFGQHPCTPPERRGLASLVRRLCGAPFILPVVVVLLALGFTGCSSDDANDSAQSTLTTGGGGRATEVVVEIGEAVELGDVTIHVTALYQTLVPLLPSFPISAGPRSGVVEGQVFCQALVRVDNRGSEAVRVDPMDFTLIAGSAGHSIDPSRSGPVARSLLPGASLDFVLTFRGPETDELELRYSPKWFNGTVVFRGILSPAGVVGSS